jgi:hypothetical protein
MLRMKILKGRERTIAVTEAKQNTDRALADLDDWLGN